jgi:hypothetical protein
MKIGKVNIRFGKMKLKGVKIFIEGRITIIDNENKFNSYGNEKVFLYVNEGYISWKQKENKNNKMKGIEEVLEDIKTNGRATYPNN